MKSQPLHLIGGPVTNTEREHEQDLVADRVANHIVITALMHVPEGMTPEQFVETVIAKVRDKQNAEFGYIAAKRSVPRV